MLSKCANPACGAKFQYLRTGKLFAIEHRNSTQGNTSATGFEFVMRDRLRYFWLCSSCSRSMTIQASSAGGVRIAPARNIHRGKRSQNCEDSSAKAEELMTTPNAAWRCNVTGTKRKLEALMKELEFLESGGYRLAMGWRPPLVFEDSPTCPKPPCTACPHPQCVLLDFVPKEHQDQIIPCRHIPLNETGETLHTLYNTGSMEEIENVLRAWLKEKVAVLGQAIRSESISLERKAR